VIPPTCETPSAWLATVQPTTLLENAGPCGEPTDWYRIGDGYLGLQSQHPGFRHRFGRLFGGCAETAPDLDTSPLVTCQVQTPGPADLSVIRFADREPLDVVDFSTEIFGDRGCREVDAGAFPGRAFGITAGDAPVVLGQHGAAIIASNNQAWEWLIGNLAVHRLLRRQQDLAMFHAGSVAIGERGVLLVGNKGSGKTTLSLTLASRGHGFLGDEMAALRLSSMELVPVRRAVSIRPGPRSSRVEVTLQTAWSAAEPFPDGGVRVRASIDELCPGNTARVVRLAAIVFLDGFQAATRLERVTPGREHLTRLTPLRSTLWNVAPAVRAMRLLGILPKARCFRLQSGGLEDAADAVEKAVLGSWD
jgi:hypothetical protein